MNSSAASYSAAGGSQSYANSSAMDSSMNSGLNQNASFTGNPNETSIDDEDADDIDEDEDEDDDDGSECSKPMAKKKSEKAKWTATEVRIFESCFSRLLSHPINTMLNLHVRFIHPLSFIPVQ